MEAKQRRIEEERTEEKEEEEEAQMKSRNQIQQIKWLNTSLSPLLLSFSLSLGASVDGERGLAALAPGFPLPAISFRLSSKYSFWNWLSFNTLGKE